MTVGGYIAVFAVLSAVAVTQQQVAFKTLENDAVLSPESTITIGHSSDVFIDVQCIVSDETAPLMEKQWSVSLENIVLPSPLDPSKTSYSREDGVLRVFSAFVREHAQDDVLPFQCWTSNSTFAVINIALHQTLFFDGMFPDTITSPENLQTLCVDRLPQLPTVSVAVHSGSSEDGISYSYCTVDSARGTYRSSSVRIALRFTSTQSVLRFRQSFPPEIVQWVIDDDYEEIRLPCQIGGSGSVLPTVFFLKNGVRIPSSDSTTDNGVFIIETNSLSHRILVVGSRRGNEGVYQCVGQVGEDGSTSTITSTYINMQYLESPTITISSTTSWSPDTTIILGQSDTPSEVVLNCTVEAHPIPTLVWFRDDGNTLQEVEGHQELTGFRETAYSELRLSVSDLKNEVEFTCRAVAAGYRKNVTMNITVYSRVVFSKHPNESGSSLNILTCVASSIPVPSITWIRIQNGVHDEQMNNSESLIHTVEDECTVTSTLQLAPIDDTTITGYYCKGDNTFFQEMSSVMETADSVPTRPEVSIGSTTPRSVVVEWTASSSLVALSHYDIILHQDRGDISRLNVSALYTSYSISGLKPFSSYSVEVAAVDGAGNSTASELVQFQTPEAAPEAAPGNIVAEAYDTVRIRLSWSPPSTGTRNGVIRKYSILYSPTHDRNKSHTVGEEEDKDDEQFISEVHSGTEVLLRMPLGPGTSYTFKVAAETVEIGPFSEEVIQQTYPKAPEFSSGPPTIFPGLDATANTIPVQLPSVNHTQFSHFWVVVVPLDSSDPRQSISLDTLEEIPSPSQNTQASMPYIAAEMSADTYEKSRRIFVLGDEDGTRSLNDFPNLYRNKPLLPDVVYTAFVRGFVPSILPQNGPRSRRQEDTPNRQYVVFSSSDLLPVTSTLTPEDGGTGSSGEINTLVYIAIGVGVLLVVVVFIVILLVKRKIKMMSRKAAEADDEQKYDNTTPVAAINPPQASVGPSVGTLPHGLTVTGAGVKQEEHVYEDPLYLKACEAYTESEEPIYKVPRPVSDTHGVDSNDDAGYEVITPTPKAKKPNTAAHSQQEMALIQHELSIELNRQSSPDTAPNVANGYYELMQHPFPVDEGAESTQLGSPAGYLQPVGVLKREEVLAGYSLLTTGTQRERQPACNLPDCSSVEYANVTKHTASDGGTIKREAMPTRVPEEYVAMQSVVPEQ